MFIFSKIPHSSSLFIKDWIDIFHRSNLKKTEPFKGLEKLWQYCRGYNGTKLVLMSCIVERPDNPFVKEIGSEEWKQYKIWVLILVWQHFTFSSKGIYLQLYFYFSWKLKGHIFFGLSVTLSELFPLLSLAGLKKNSYSW